MSITEIVILTLLGIDIANVLMIAYVFHWAKNAIHRFREITVELLSTENPESDRIIGHVADRVTDATIRAVKGNLLTLRRQIGSMIPGVGAQEEESQENGESVPSLPAIPSLSGMLKNVPAGVDPASMLATKLGIPPEYVSAIRTILQRNGSAGSSGSTAQSNDQYW